MSRIILLALIIWLIYVILKRAIKTTQKPAKNNAVEDIVQCAYCGVYSPKLESYIVDQQYFCCLEHSKQINKESNSQ